MPAKNPSNATWPLIKGNGAQTLIEREKLYFNALCERMGEYSVTATGTAVMLKLSRPYVQRLYFADITPIAGTTKYYAGDVARRMVERECEHARNDKRRRRARA